MPRVSLGVDAEFLERDVAFDSRTLPGTLKGTAYSAYLGLDLWRWITLYGTAGSVFLDSFEPIASDGFDNALRWSAGLNASLWHVDTTTPDFMKGRFSIGLIIDYCDNTGASDSGDVTWTTTSVSLPIGFEIPNEPMIFWGVTSMYVFAGPLYSAIDGKVENDSLSDFSEEQDWGVLGGVDIYLAPNVSLGGHLQYVSSVSANLSARYHF